MVPGITSWTDQARARPKKLVKARPERPGSAPQACDCILLDAILSLPVLRNGQLQNVDQSFFSGFFSHGINIFYCFIGLIDLNMRL